MKRLVLYTIAVFLAALASMTASAQTATPDTAPAAQGRRHHSPEKMFRRLDKNNDGRISRDEWARRPKAFARLDANNDGFITREELAARGQRQGGHDGRGKRALAEMDRNNDGQISRDEWARKPKAFDRLDLNHDGFITADELKQVRRRR
ncbi:MAG TPA: EF-hand domain-containing protein [Blastocatellia bacterium]|nr:EF-hand domain-containing protein [Blastocatellia bacterium]